MSDRGEYASIPKVLIDGPDFQQLPANARFVFLALCLTFNGLGIEVRYPDALVAELVAQTGLDGDTVRYALDDLEKAHWVSRESNVVWLRGRLTHSGLTVANAKKHVPHVRKVVAGLPRLAIVAEFVGCFREWFEEDGKRIDSFAWTSSSLSKAKRKGTDSLSIAYRKPTDSQDLPKNFPNQDVDTSATALPSRNWVAEGATYWRARIGDIAEPRFGKALSGCVALHGWPAVFSAMQEYAAGGQGGKTKKVEWFAQDVVRWIAESNEPLIDEYGCPTPKADRIVRASA
jgi:hypothetical protein